MVSVIAKTIRSRRHDRGFMNTVLLSSHGPNPSPSPCPYRPPSQRKRKKKDLDLLLTLKSTLLSMKECSGKKVQKIKVGQTHPAKKIDQMDSKNKDLG